MNSKPRALKSGPETAAMMRLFLTEKRTVGRLRPLTIESYDRALRMFELHAPARVADLGREHLHAWTMAMVADGLKPGAIRSYQAPVWVWLRWLYRNDYAEHDLSAKVSRYKCDEWERTRRTATEEGRSLFIANALAQCEFPQRNAAIVEVLWSTGLRRAELVALQMQDLDLDAGAVTVQHGKGGKPRVVGIGTQARYALERYFAVERGWANGPVFLARKKRPMTTAALTCVLRRLSKRSGVHVAAHDFRRATASRLLSAGVEVDVVQHQLGHARPDMSLMYGAAGRTRRSLESFHAVDVGVRKMRAR